MAGHFDYPTDVTAEMDLVAFAQADVATGNVFVGRAGYSRSGRLLDREVSAGVVGVPMRVPDLVDRPSATLGFGKRRRRVSGVDDCTLAAPLVMNEPEVVVGESRDSDDFHERRHYS